jgi:preprotein translocase subunit SecE
MVKKMKKLLDKTLHFLRDVRSEMHSVTWPNRDDLKEGTTVVIVMSALVAIFLSLVDFIFSQIITRVF